MATKKTKAKSKTKKTTKKVTAKKATKKLTAKSKKTAPKKTAKAKTKSKTTGSAKAISKPAVSIGQTLPTLTLPATGGRTVSLSDLKGKHVVLFFYPKDSTPGCTMEGHDFTRLHDQFKATNTEVFGISRDNMKSHEKFKECESYSIDLLSDEDEKASKVFGVIKMKNMYGREVRGIERSTFVIDADGKLVKEWRGVSVPGHAEEVLNFVKGL
ncbi:MAG: peroxiredoxin [Bdellovibrionales bacterium]